MLNSKYLTLRCGNYRVLWCKRVHADVPIFNDCVKLVFS